MLKGELSDYADPWQDPPPDDDTIFAEGERVMVFVNFGGGLPGQEFSVEFAGPDGSLVGPWVNNFDDAGTFPLRNWSWAWYAYGAKGAWVARIRVDGLLADEMHFVVE